jgi:hypothetical protein
MGASPMVWLLGIAVLATLWAVLAGAAPAGSALPNQEDGAAAANAHAVRSQQPAADALRAGFDPERLAYLEAAGWRAYYDRNWPRVFRLMVQMNREQFRMPLPTAIATAVDIVRASIAFAPVDNDVPAATSHLRSFYGKALRSLGLAADARTLAALEMDYWIVHRRLALERKQAPSHDGDVEPMVDSLARLHAALFIAPPEAIRRSAELRAQAAVAVDRITGGYSTDVEDDWRQVEESLRQAYRALAQESSRLAK